MKSGMARTQIGTPYYMSPEIWNNKPYDDKSDTWALGCLVFEMAQLAPPFLANDMNGLALKVKTTAAVRISKHYSEDLANLVATMLCEWPFGVTRHMPRLLMRIH
jgi:NIMA (never in mitosis gene a)-related kinase